MIEHTKDCLLEEAGQCTCDAMTDEVSDTFLALRLKVSALLNTLRQHVRNVLAKLKGNNS